MKRFLAIIGLFIAFGLIPFISFAQNTRGQGNEGDPCGDQWLYHEKCRFGLECIGGRRYVDETGTCQTPTPSEPAPTPNLPIWFGTEDKSTEKQKGFLSRLTEWAGIGTKKEETTLAARESTYIHTYIQTYTTPAAPTPTPTRFSYSVPATTDTIMPCGIESNSDSDIPQPQSKNGVLRACLAPICKTLIKHPAEGSYTEFKQCEKDAQKKFDDTKALIDAQLTEKIKSYEAAYDALPKEVTVYVHDEPAFPNILERRTIKLPKLADNLIDLINGCKTPDKRGSGIGSCLYKIQEEYKKQTKITQYNLTPQALSSIINAITGFEENTIKPQLEKAATLHREEKAYCWNKYPHKEPWDECVEYEQSNCRNW